MRGKHRKCRLPKSACSVGQPNEIWAWAWAIDGLQKDSCVSLNCRRDHKDDVNICIP